MANPYLVIGGIAVGIATAGFGILQVPGWIDSAKDASAQNDISQVAIAQAAALSVNGVVKDSLTAINSDTKVGVKVTTENPVDIYTSADDKNYGVIAESESGKFFTRVDGGPIVSFDTEAEAIAAMGSLTAGPGN